MSSSITYILLGVVLVVGIFVLVKRFITKKKQRDNFNAFIKPTLKETLKKEGFPNHSYEIIHRYHHSLTNQNRLGQVDIILNVFNPKIGESSSTTIGYTLMMKEVPVTKKEFVWEVDSIERTEVSAIEALLTEKEDRKKHKMKYFKKDVVKTKDRTKEKLKNIKGGFSKGGSFLKPKVKEEKKEMVEERKVSDPFEVLD